MNKITSQIHKKQRNALLIYGIIYFIIGIIPQFTEESSGLLSWSYVVIGLIMLITIGYRAYLGTYVSVIKWNSKMLAFKSPESKFIQFKRSAIKSVKLTEKSLTINAGLGDGEMIDLNYFKIKDLDFFSKDFMEEEVIQPQAYNLAEA